VGEGDLYLVIMTGPGEADTVRAAAQGSRVVSLRPGPEEAEVVRTAKVGRWDYVL
jgi:hypothetical protein